ncbi:MAG: DUF6049 family protein [Mycobacteriales bacterium]
MRRLAALLALGVLTAVPAAADTTPTPTPAPEDPLQVRVTRLLPRAPQPGDAIELFGTVRNTGDEPVTSVSMRLRLGDRITTRSGLHDADTDRPVTSRRSGSVVQLTATDLAPGQSAVFDIRTTVARLGLDGVGVYPFDVEARGDAGNGIESLGLAPTWLPYFAGERPRRTRVAVVWPLVDHPHQAGDSTLLDDSLAGSLAGSGRLGRLLTAARGAETGQCDPGARYPDSTPAAPHATPPVTHCEAAPVTYAVDPDLLAAAGVMSAPYRLKDGAKGTGTQAAASWLASLRDATSRSQVVALPYADPDVTALSRYGSSKDDIGYAQDLGSRAVAETLGVQALATVAWPPAGPVTQAAADTLSLGGARAFVLDPTAYDQPDGEPARTPSAQTVLATSATGAELDGLVIDPQLSDLMTGTDAAEGPRLAEQRFLAETAVVAAEAPGISRTLVLAPPRRGDVVPGTATAALLDLGRIPWLCPVAVAEVAAHRERCSDAPDDASPVPETRGDLRDDRDGELSSAYLRSVVADRDQVSQLTDAVMSDTPDAREAVARIKTRLRRAVARAESSAWRTDPSAGRDTAAALHREVQRLRSRIVVRGGRALLTSSKGTLQVSLENTLDVPVQVRVRFSSKTATLSTAETGLVEVDPGRAVPASVRAEALRSGQFVVFAQIVDRNGRPFGPEAEVIVRSTRYGRLALAVTIAGLGVLLLAAGVRVVRRATRGRA